MAVNGDVLTYRPAPIPMATDEDGAYVVDSMWPVDEAAFIWSVYEGFYRQAAGDNLEIVEVRDMGTVPPETIPASVEATLGRRHRRDFIWRVFEADAKLPPWMAAAMASSQEATEQIALEQAQAIEEQQEDLGYA